MRRCSVALLAYAIACGARSNDDAPNVVIVYADDVGFNDFGAHVFGANPGQSPEESATPFLDSLATGGIRLNNSYAFVWCAPSRGALLSGRYPMHTGYIESGCGDPGSGCALPLEFPLLPELLKPARYTAWHLGKWHLGMRSAAHLPSSRGFDYSLGYLSGGEDYYTKVAEGGACANSSFGRFDFWENDAPATDDAYRARYSTELYAARAVELITAHEPFETFAATAEDGEVER